MYITRLDGESLFLPATSSRWTREQCVCNEASAYSFEDFAFQCLFRIKRSFLPAAERRSATGAECCLPPPPLLSLALFKLGALMMVPFSLLTTDGRVCVCVRTISRERRRQTNLIAPRSPAVPRAPNYLRGKNISAPRTQTCNQISYQFHRPDSESFYLSLIWRVGQNISITRRR